MSKIHRVTNSRGAVMSQAMLQVTTPIDAEYITVLTRRTMGRLWFVRTARSSVSQLRVPFTHITDLDLIVGVTDADGLFACKFVDGVRAELVDGNQVTMRR